MLIIEHITPDGNLIDRFEMADGMTVNQAACSLCPDSGGVFSIPTVAFVGSRPALKSKGDWVIPLSNVAIQFRQLPLGGGGGGGSNPMQMVLQIAIIAAAAAATAFLGGTGGFLMGTLGWSTTAAAIGASLASAGIMLLGTMLMGVLFQQSLPQGQAGAMSAEQASPTYNINSSGNQARLYQTEPELFGRMKIVPDFVSNTWTEFVDNDQIGFFVYGIGRGDYEFESLQFGETVFWRNGVLLEDSGYEIQDIEFVKPGNPVTIFPDNILTSSEVNGQQLFGPNEEEYDGAIGPYAANAPGTFTNKLALDFVFQQGIGHYNDQGGLDGLSVDWVIEAQKIDDFGESIGDWITLENVNYWGATLTPQRITRTYSVENGRYRVRVRRLSDHISDGRALDTLVWSSLRAVLPGTYEYPISCIAFSVKANNALTQSASRQFSVIATRKLPLYDRATKTWGEPVATRSWAAAVSHVCKCEWGGRLTDSDIDLDALWAIDERLRAKNWYYDAYIDGAYLVWVLLCEMCQSQCVIPRLMGPVLSFVEDGAQRAPVFALTPRNIVRNSFAINYATWSDDTPDDVTVEYLDAEYGFQQRDVTAILPESESREPSSLDILGITDRSHAHKVAVAYAAHNRWQRVSVECQIEALGRMINRGDICTVAHPRFKNTCAGAIDWWNEASLLVCVKFDFQLPDQGQKTDRYYIENPPQADYPKTLESLVSYGINTDKTNVIETSDDSSLYTSLDTEFQSRLAVTDEDRYIAFTRQNGSIWGPCKIASIEGNKITLDSADYSTLLLQGQGNPFEFFTSGRDRQPTTWTLYTSKNYQRLMIVDSVTSQDAIHYNLKLLNYDDRIYQYDNLPVPLWQGRGQLPDSDTLSPPKYLRGVIETESAITVSWLQVDGASWYEVQSSLDGQSWQNVGRVNETSILLVGTPGIVWVRVRAGNNNMMSNWAKWHGDTLNVAPDVPRPRIAAPYVGASAKISWPRIDDATSYVVGLKSPSGASIYTATQTGTTFEITPEIQTGGPYRNLTFEVAARNEAGASPTSSIRLSDPAPPVPDEIIISANDLSGSVTFVVSALNYPSNTGYIIAMSHTPNFGINDVLEVRAITQIPYEWTNLLPGGYFFRVALKDAFYDAAPIFTSLNWSKAYPVEVKDV